MEKNVWSGKLQKQKGFLLFLPVLVLPFATMAFWALDGGKGENTDQVALKQDGLNLNLPSAQLKDNGSEDKLSFYEKARKDEQQTEDAIKNDPYYQLPNQDTVPRDSNELAGMMSKYPSKYTNGLNASPVYAQGYKDPNEEKIMQRLNMLQNQINRPQPEMLTHKPSFSQETLPLSDDVDRLGEMMTLMKDKQQDDPEMDRLEGVLDKVMDIQHPDQVRERIKEKSLQQKQKVLSVTPYGNNRSVSLFGKGNTGDKKDKSKSSGFYSAARDRDIVEGAGNAIEAVVHETQTLVNGSVVKLRTLNDIYIAGTLIPKGNFIFGLASLSGERLQIIVNSIHYQQSLFSTDLEVHDIDGLTGVYVPGSITRDVAKQSIDNGMQGLEMASLNQSIGIQAASAGISAAKNLLSRKVRLIKVTVKAGYKVLLLDKNNRD